MHRCPIPARRSGYTSIHALRDAGVTQTALEKPADADAFRSMGLDRRRALWEASALQDRPTGLFTGQPSESTSETWVRLPEMTAAAHVIHDYSATSVSLKTHPVTPIRMPTQKKIFPEARNFK